MIKKILVLLLILIIFYPQKAFAIEDPTGLPNNKFGIHILFTEELAEAARLINSNGGDWGYVTIPIQAGDRDLEKWQDFMDRAKKLHIIPIIRLATEGDYFNTKVWRKPDYNDVLDFANFLDSLEWPVKNRYIIVFNEVNRSDEWGGMANPSEYARILSYAYIVFKSKSADFFIISAGLDNAAANVTGQSYNQYNFMRKMNEEIPGIFNQIDGLSSHSYPNPAFAKPPDRLDNMSIASFKYERDLAMSLTVKEKKIPIFITETGWSKEAVSEKIIPSYYSYAFANVWNDENIIAVTPFLLRATGGPFTVFSFINTDGSESDQFKTFLSLSKTKGEPGILQKILGDRSEENIKLKSKNFMKTDINSETEKSDITGKKTVEILFKWIMKL